MTCFGAPGCARSRKANVVDWVLPWLQAGDGLTRADIVAPGPGACWRTSRSAPCRARGPGAKVDISDTMPGRGTTKDENGRSHF
ncbi:MAG: hypothetical protein HY784_17225 [Chloroflexi bacterium]|nr:hypothetical protein [Chloroflexota bacterium]